MSQPDSNFWMEALKAERAYFEDEESSDDADETD